MNFVLCTLETYKPKKYTLQAYYSSSLFLDTYYTPGMSEGRGQGGSCPPRFWRIRRRRRAVAARRIITCPPRFLDFATYLHSVFVSITDFI